MARNKNRPPYFWWVWWWELEDGNVGDSVVISAKDMPLKPHESSKAVLDSLTRAGKAMQFAGVLKHPTQVRTIQRDGELCFQIELLDERKRTGFRRDVSRPRHIPLGQVQGYERKASERVKSAKMLLLEQEHGKSIEELIVEAYNQHGFRGACHFLGVADPTLTTWAKQFDIIFFQGAAKREKIKELGVRILPARGLPLQEPQE